MNDYDNNNDGAIIAVIGSLSSFSKRRQRRYPTTSSSIMIARDGGAASAAIIKPIVRNKTSHHRQHEEEEDCCRRLTTSLQTTTKSPTRTSNSRRKRTIRCRFLFLLRQRLLVLPLFLFLLLLLLFSTMNLVDAAAKSPTTITTSTSTTKHIRSRRRQSLGRQSQPSTTSTTTGSASAAWWTGLKSGLASAASAGCVKTLLQPIDAIKTVQQYHQTSGSTAAGLSIKAACQHLLQSSRNQNKWPLSNFYAGLGVTVFGSMPGVALYFGVYSYCKRRLSTATTAAGPNGRQQTTTTATTAVIALSAAIGNTVASFSRVPYEVVKQKLQTGLYASTWDVFREMAGSPKMALELMFPKGGVYVQMLRDVPYAIVTLLMYETLRSHRRRQQAMMMMNSGGGGKKKDKNNKNSNKKKKTTKRGVDIGDFLLGGIAGGIGSWVTNPMDVLKTRLQTDIGTKLYGGSIWTCTKSVWNEGGPQAFLRGSVPRLMHKVPANAFFFLFYEFFKRVLHVVDDDDGSS